MACRVKPNNRSHFRIFISHTYFTHTYMDYTALKCFMVKVTGRLNWTEKGPTFHTHMLAGANCAWTWLGCLWKAAAVIQASCINTGQQDYITQVAQQKWPTLLDPACTSHAAANISLKIPVQQQMLLASDNSHYCQINCQNLAIMVSLEVIWARPSHPVLVAWVTEVM